MTPTEAGNNLSRTDEQGALLEEIPCLRCGYLLRGLPTHAFCPECATPVSESLVSDRLIDADRRWVGVLAKGCILIVIGSVAWGASAAIGGIDLPTPEQELAGLIPAAFNVLGSGW